MKAIKKPIKVDCWLITQKELNNMYEKLSNIYPKFDECVWGMETLGCNLHGANVLIHKKLNKKNITATICDLNEEIPLRAGDYLIKEENKFYTCSSNIFKKKYKIIK